MKKLISLFVILSVIGILGISAVNAAATIKPVKVTKKIVKVVKKTVKKIAPKKVVPIIIVPTPQAVPTIPPPASMPVAQTQKYNGLFGWNINTNIAGIYTNCGQGVMGTVAGRISLPIVDSYSLGSLIGLSANAVSYNVGLGAVYGKDINDADIKALPVYGDVVVSLPKMYELDSYVSGGLNYTLYGSGQTMGSYGAQVSVGTLVDLGLGLGKTGIELGYNAVRANGSTPTLSAKGIMLSISQGVLI